MASEKNSARRKRKYGKQQNDGHKRPGFQKGRLRAIAKRERTLTFLIPGRGKPTMEAKNGK